MLEIELGTTHESLCACCGSTTTTLTRFVHRDGNAHAVYYVSFSQAHSDGIVKATVSMGEWGEPDSQEQRIAFTLELRAGPDNYEVMVTDASASPWRDKAFLGRMLDREEALSHEWIDDVFRVTDQMLLDDAPLKNYLESPHPH